MSSPPPPARQGSLRDRNLALVLELIAQAPAPLSRAALAARTGLTRATASALADSLLALGLIEEVGPPPAAGAGRPAAGLVPAGSGPAGLGLELNVDYLAACVLDQAGTVRRRELVHADLRGRAPGRVFADLAALAHRVVRQAAGDGLDLAGVSVAVPGLVDPATGGILRAPNLGWRETDARGLLAPLLPAAPLPLRIGNEADCAAEGELHLDAGRELADFLYLSGEIGIGAGIVLGRRVFPGPRGWGGEIGHATVRPGGEQCRCGAHGCLETVAGQEAILRAAGAAAGIVAGSAAGTGLAARGTAAGAGAGGLSAGGPSAGGLDASAEGAAGPAIESIAGLVDLAASGDAGVLAALTVVGTALGNTLATAVNLLDLGTVVLGGIYAPLAQWLAPAIEAELMGHVVSAAWATPVVRTSRAGVGAAALGAAASVVGRIQADPAGWAALRRQD